MLVAWVQEQLRVVDRGDDLARRLDVALADEDRIGVHAVDLDRHSLRPRPERPLPADRDAGVEEQRSARARPRGRCDVSSGLPSPSVNHLRLAGEDVEIATDAGLAVVDRRCRLRAAPSLQDRVIIRTNFAVTAAPGTTEFCGSTTLPVMLPRDSCARQTVESESSSATPIEKARLRVRRKSSMNPPLRFK